MMKFYDENMAIMAKRRDFIETVYIQCIKRIYTVIQFNHLTCLLSVNGYQMVGALVGGDM